MSAALDKARARLGEADAILDAVKPANRSLPWAAAVIQSSLAQAMIICAGADEVCIGRATISEAVL